MYVDRCHTKSRADYSPLSHGILSYPYRFVKIAPANLSETFALISECKKLLTYFFDYDMLDLSKEFYISTERLDYCMDNNGIQILGILAMGFILFCAISIIWMVVSMARKGDERRREIISRASCTTLYITLGSLGADILYGIYRSVAHGQAIEGNNPFVQLAVISFVYAISLAVYRRKYGG